MSTILPLLTSVFLFSINVIVFLDCGFSNGFYSFPEFYVICNILYIQIWIKLFFSKKKYKTICLFCKYEFTFISPEFQVFINSFQPGVAFHIEPSHFLQSKTSDWFQYETQHWAEINK